MYVFFLFPDEQVETDSNPLERLNTDDTAGEAVGYLVKALRRWGVKDGEYDMEGFKSILDFHRGGAPSRSCLPKAHTGRTLCRLGRCCVSM